MSAATEDRIAQIDPAQLADYEKGATEPAARDGARRIAPEGSYLVQMPDQIVVSINSRKDGFNAIVEGALMPMRISGGEFDGQEFDVDTYSKKFYFSTTLVRDHNESSLGALLRNFGVSREQIARYMGSGDADVWQAAIDEFVVGKVTPSAVSLIWRGTDYREIKRQIAELGGYQNVDRATQNRIEKSLTWQYSGPARKAGQQRFDVPVDAADLTKGYKSYIEIPERQITNKQGELVATRVYANLVSGFMGFLPRTAK